MDDEFDIKMCDEQTLKDISIATEMSEAYEMDDCGVAYAMCRLCYDTFPIRDMQVCEAKECFICKTCDKLILVKY